MREYTCFLLINRKMNTSITVTEKSVTGVSALKNRLAFIVLGNLTEPVSYGASGGVCFDILFIHDC